MPFFKDKVEIIYEENKPNKVIKKYGNFELPVIFSNGILFSQGYVPIMKKIGKKLLEMSRD
ncbi:MAG: hypothetical protein ACFFG0_35265 [Candidatus Thorarchaeota archaeon]